MKKCLVGSLSLASTLVTPVNSVMGIKNNVQPKVGIRTPEAGPSVRDPPNYFSECC